MGPLHFLRAEDIDRAQDWFVRRGAASVFWARLLPGIRTFISLPAGIAGQVRDEGNERVCSGRADSAWSRS